MRKIFPNFKHFLGKAASRKGMGMELALLVLFVVFACSTLLVSSAMLGKDNLNDRKDQMLQRFELDEIAGKVLNGEAVNDDNYSLTRDGNTFTIIDQFGNILTVTVENGTITYWHYG